MSSSTSTSPPIFPSVSEFQEWRRATINVANFVSSKLSSDQNSNNYRAWKEQMMCLVESQDLLRFIDGKASPPPKTDQDYDVWRRTDRLVKGWILGALSDDVINNSVLRCHSSRDVWLTLEKRFTGSHETRPTAPPPPNQAQHDWHEYLPLYRATLMGDWNKAKETFDQDPNATKSRIAFTLEIPLHIAVGTGKALHFVEKLVAMMSNEDLEIRDELGYNALHVAALTGNTEAARILVGRCPGLLYVASNKDEFPVHLAALSAHRETLRYLINETKDEVTPSPYVDEVGVRLLNTVIDADFFDVALYLAQKYPDLSRLKLDDGNSALKRIALKEYAFSDGRHLSLWERFIYSSNESRFPTPHYVMAIRRKKIIRDQALELVKCLCKNMESLEFSKASAIYKNVMLIAARLGIHEIIEEIVQTFPASIYSRDFNSGQYIFHLAVQNRCESVFNLIYQTSDLKHQYSDIADKSGNTLLHLAARLAPPHKLNMVSGAALQMQRELQWFKEVEKFLHPYFRERSNKVGKTPKMVFTEEHKNLKAEGEKWMKDTATSCTIAAALIATVVFAAAITVPGGNESNTGRPLFSKHGAFTIFAVSDAVSLFTSTTSLLMFLSILTSRYAEEDFLYALPKRLIIGLITLFVSISFMIAAFSATLVLVFGRKNDLVLIPVGALACLPITSFALLQFPLLVDVVSSTYGRGIFGRQSDRPFY